MSESDAVTVRLDEIEKKLAYLVGKIDIMSSAAGVIDVHAQRLAEVEKQVHALWQRWDALTGQDGAISKIKNHQASCPRTQVKWVWITLVPMSLVMLATAYALIK